jgi:hypothetical protein
MGDLMHKHVFARFFRIALGITLVAITVLSMNACNRASNPSASKGVAKLPSGLPVNPAALPSDIVIKQLDRGETKHSQDGIVIDAIDQDGIRNRYFRFTTGEPWAAVSQRFINYYTAQGYTITIARAPAHYGPGAPITAWAGLISGDMNTEVDLRMRDLHGRPEFLVQVQEVLP